MSLYQAFAYGSDKKKYGSGSLKNFYNQPSAADYKSGKGFSLKPGYISSSTPLHSGYGDALYRKASKKIVTRRNPKTGNTYGMSPGLYIYNDPKAAQQQQQQAFQQQLQATASKSQADIAKQLQIVQSEKSAVSKMMEEYNAQLTAEADRRKKADEEARVSAATSAANQSRSGQTANLQIQPASSTPTTAGTDAFRIRKRRRSDQKQLASSLNIGQSNTLNI